MIAFKESSLTSAMDINQSMELNSAKELNNSPLEATKSKQPSPSSFLSNLKDFNIENAKYRHYGHLMTSQQLDKIVNQGADNKEGSRKNTNSKSSDSLSYNLTSPLAYPSEHISKALELPANKLYSEAIVSQMLLLRKEQEKTKHTQEKIELGRVVTLLLKEAEAHGIGSNLIHRLFLDEDSEEYKAHIMKVRTQSVCGKLYVSENMDQNPHMAVEKNSPICTPSPKTMVENGNETLAGSGSSKFAASTPITSEAKNNTTNNTHLFPATVSVRTEQNALVSSDDRNGVSNVTESWEPKTEPISKPVMTRLQNSSAMPLVTQPMYPIYYQVPEHYVHQRKLTQTHSTHGSDLGLPNLAHKHPGVLIQPPHQFSPPTGVITQNTEMQNMGHFHSGYPQHVQEQPVYYMNSQPPGTCQGAPIMAPQFFPLPPIGPTGPVPWVAPPVVHEKDWENEEAYAHKKHRGTKNGISFMINTPKNPPARKYKKRTENS